jgi:hypothetical protein
MCEPAKSIITRCGGVAVVADWLGLNRTSVLRWTHARDKGGSGGLVPSKHQAALLAAARQHGKRLEPSDFILRAPVDRAA